MRDAGPVWRAQYSTDDNKLSWEVEGIESLACPVSCITEESKADVHRFFQQQSAHKATGGVLYGADINKWPARWLDVVTLIQGEIDRERGAYERAKAAYINAQRR